MIKESKSVSDITVSVSNEIVSRLKHYSMNNPQHFIGQYTYVKASDGQFTCGKNYIDVFGSPITVIYEIFYCGDDGEYKSLLMNNVLDCISDTANNSIKIGVAVVNGEIVDDYVDDVYHEVNHLLQNAMGASKNETLYDKCVSFIKSVNVDKPLKAPAYAIYYTFKTEQDSFAPQFYSYLQRQKSRVTDFEKALYDFPIYRSLINSYKMTLDNIDDPQIKNVFERIGLTPNKWRQTVESGIQRLKRKLTHAFQKYTMDSLKIESVRGMIRQQEYLYERFGNYKLKTELFLDF